MDILDPYGRYAASLPCFHNYYTGRFCSTSFCTGELGLETCIAPFHSVTSLSLMQTDRWIPWEKASKYFMG